MFNFLLGNADAHAKNVSLLHLAGGVRLAPLYDIVSTAVYPRLSVELALAIGDELDPDAITSIHGDDLADDLGLSAGAFKRARRGLCDRVKTQARALRDEARAQGWHHPCLESILGVIDARGARVL